MLRGSSRSSFNWSRTARLGETTLLGRNQEVVLLYSIFDIRGLLNQEKWHEKVEEIRPVGR